MKTFNYFDGKSIVYEESFWTGKKSIKIDGVELQKAGKNQYLYEENLYKLKGNFLSGAKLVGNYGTIVLVQSLEALDWVLVFLPLVLAFIGGLVGAVCAVVAMWMNALTVRQCKNNGKKILICLGSCALAFIAYLAVVFIIAMIAAPVL